MDTHSRFICSIISKHPACKNAPPFFSILCALLIGSCTLIQNESSGAGSFDTLSWNKLEQSYPLINHWHFRHGDSLAWALPDYDDNHWEKLYEDSDRTKALSVYADQYGVMWFRVHLWADTSMVSKMLALSTNLLGACEIYMDGKLVRTIGTLGISRKKEVSGFRIKSIPLPFSWDRPGAHLLAFRITNYSEKEKAYYIHFSSNTGFIQFESKISKLDNEMNGLLDFSDESKILIFSGIFITLTLFHFVLFLYYRKNRTNLYYSLFTFFLSIIFFGSYQIISGTDLHATQQIVLLEMCAVFLAPLFFLALLYQVFYKRLLPVYWILIVLLVAAGLFLFYTENKSIGGLLIAIFLIGVIIETIRIFVRAWVKKKDGAGIFLLGILFPPIGTLLLWIISIIAGKIGLPGWEKSLSRILEQFFGYAMLLSVSVSMTIYLARDFARMNKKLQLQLREIKQLFEKTVVQESERKRILENQKTELERKVIERTAEVTEQKGEIERKNRDILDNLNYAKRIQSAILPETSLIHNSLPDSFILYRPKDIVSGDFYTFSHKDNRILLSVADCTGHGVTGAFMSMIGSSQLNQIINERGITQPAKILNHLNTGIAEALKQNATDVNDGMDIALCSFSPDTRSLEFAGANRPMWLIRGGEWFEIKPDKLAIGGFRVQREAVFTNHEIQLQPGDAIYLFTDGFADQFGGPDGKKMLSKRFRELLISMQSESMQEQERKLNHYFDKWKNSLEQVDDVLVIGIRI